MLILAIETSCDETAACIMDDAGRVLSDAVATQIEIHRTYGGVVPEIASRKHLEALPFVVEDTLQRAGVSLCDIDAFAVTYGPGLVGALLCGVSYAKGLCCALNRPFIGIHHMEGHIMANHVTHPDLETPYLCLVASGGHTCLIHVQAPFQYKLLGQTHDDAAGEAFDKVARVLGLPYPGGPHLEELAKAGNAKAFRFTKPKTDNAYDYSFSGLKTAVLSLMRSAAKQGETPCGADIAASFQAHAVDFLLEPAFLAMRDFGIDTLSLVGGVCANKALRQRAQDMAKRENRAVRLPDMKLCTDNAVMIAEAARRRLAIGERSDLTLNAIPNMPLYGRERSPIL